MDSGVPEAGQGCQGRPEFSGIAILLLKVLLQAEKLAPAQLVTQYHLASAYFSKGDHNQARHYLQAVINAQPAMSKQPDVARMMNILKMA